MNALRRVDYPSLLLSAAIALAAASTGLRLPPDLLLLLATTAVIIALACRALRASPSWVLPFAFAAALAAAAAAGLQMQETLQRVASPSSDSPPGQDDAAILLWAVACGLLGAALAWTPTPPRARRLVRASAALVGAVAAIFLMVGILGVDYLYSPALFPHTTPAASLTALLMALAQWRHTHATRRGAPVEDRIVGAAALVLGLALLITSSVAFIEMRRQIERDQGALLATQLNHKANLLASEIETARLAASAVAARPSALAAMVALHSADEDSEAQSAARSALQRIANTVGETAFRSFVFLDANGRDVAMAGRPISTPGVLIDLPVSGAQLLWSDGYVLRTSSAVQVDGELVGHLVGEQPLRNSQSVLEDVKGLGETAEIELCAQRQQQVVCFPSRFNPGGRTRPLATPARLPSDRAAMGEQDPVWETDYRGKKVLAALHPMPTLRLGLVGKRDADEVLEPVRRLVEWGLPLLALVVAAAFWLLGQRLKPMARAVIDAKQDAERHAARWSALNEAALDGFLMLKPLRATDGEVVDWSISHLNPAAEHLLRLRREDALSRPVSMSIRHASAGEVLQRCAEVLQSRQPATFESSVERMDDAPRWLHYNVIPFRGGIALTIKDLTERRKAELELAEARERLQMITDQLPATIAFVDAQHVFRFNNLACEEWFDRPLARITGQPVKELMGADAYTAHARAMDEAARTRQPATAEDSSRRPGPTAILEVSYIPQFDEHEVLTGFCLLGRDVTASRLKEHQLQQAAYRDELTGLPNRAAFNARLAQSLQRMAGGGRRFSVAYIDLDYFKQVNDTRGHAAGDELLKTFGQRVVAVLRRNDMVARLGGDEFALVLEDLDDISHAHKVSDHLYGSFSAPVPWESTPLQIMASMGLAIATRSDTPKALLVRADEALYAAKARGRNNCVIR